MTINLTEIGISNEAVEKSEAQSISNGGVWKSSAEEVVIKEMASFDTKSGAKMLKLVLTNAKEEELTQYINIVKKDKSENEIGTRVIVGISEAIGIDDAGFKPVVFKAYKVEEQAGIGFTNFIGKKLIACVIECFEAGAQYESSNEVEAYVNLKGENSKGEDVVAAFNKKIEKNPIRNKKAKAAAANTASADSDEAAKVTY